MPEVTDDHSEPQLPAVDAAGAAGASVAGAGAGAVSSGGVATTAGGVIGVAISSTADGESAGGTANAAAGRAAAPGHVPRPWGGAGAVWDRPGGGRGRRAAIAVIKENHVG